MRRLDYALIGNLVAALLQREQTCADSGFDACAKERQSERKCEGLENHVAAVLHGNHNGHDDVVSTKLDAHEVGFGEVGLIDVVIVQERLARAWGAERLENPLCDFAFARFTDGSLNVLGPICGGSEIRGLCVEAILLAELLDHLAKHHGVGLHHGIRDELVGEDKRPVLRQRVEAITFTGGESKSGSDAVAERDILEGLLSRYFRKGRVRYRARNKRYGK